jgi:hypothetical protein
MFIGTICKIGLAFLNILYIAINDNLIIKLELQCCEIEDLIINLDFI